MSQLRYETVFEAIADDPTDAADMRFRADMMLALRKIFENKGWKQAEIAAVLGVAQPRVSELLRGKIDLFSSDRLIGFLAKLNYRLRPAVSENQEVICEVLQVA